MRTEGRGLSLISFYTRIKSPHHFSQGLTKKIIIIRRQGRGCVGEIYVGEMHTPTLQTHASMQSPEFFRGDAAYHLYTRV